MLRRRPTRISLVAVLAVLIASVPMAAAHGQVPATQLMQDLPAVTSPSFVAVKLVDVTAFDADGGVAVIDRGTAAEEWLEYQSIDLVQGELVGLSRPYPSDHVAGAWVEPVPTASSVPVGVETPDAGILGPAPQPVVNPTVIDPPDPSEVTVDSPDIGPTGTDPAPVYVPGPDPAPVGADAPPVHVDGVDPAPVYEDPDPIAVDGIDPPAVYEDPDPVAIDGIDPAPVYEDPDPIQLDGIDPSPVVADPDPIAIDGIDLGPVVADPDPIQIDAIDPDPIAIDGPPTPPLEIFVNPDPICTPPLDIGVDTGPWVETIREILASLLQKSSSSGGVDPQPYADYLEEWAAYLPAVDRAQTSQAAWTLFYQADALLTKLDERGVVSFDPVRVAVSDLLAGLVADGSIGVAPTSSAVVIPDTCLDLSSLDTIRIPEIDPDPVELDVRPLPGIYEDPDAVAIDAPAVPDVYEDPDAVAIDGPAVPGAYEDPDPVEIDGPAVPGVYEDPDPVGIDAAPLPDVYYDPVEIYVDPDPVNDVDLDVQPVGYDVQKLPDVDEDPPAVIVEPIEPEPLKIDPPDLGPATSVDASEVTETLVGGAGLPAGAETPDIPIIDVPVSEPGPRSGWDTNASTSTTSSTSQYGDPWSCWYYETTHAAGGFIEGEPPDTNYGVDTALGAHTYNRSYNNGADVTRNTSSSWAAAGHHGTYNNNTGRVRQGSVTVPWRVAGRFDLGISCTVGFSCSQAEAHTDVEIVLRDTTMGTAIDRRTVPRFEAEGDTVANYYDDGTEEIPFTWQPGHTYKVLIKITGYASTDIPYPGLGARATNDAFTGQRRAWFKYVKWNWYNGNRRVNCG